MRCEEYNELIWEAAETGVLSDGLSRHMDSCATCRKSYAALTQAVSDLGKMKAVAAPDPRYAVRERLTGQTSWWKPALVLTPVAACVAALLLVLLHSHPQPVGKHLVAVSPPARRGPRGSLPELPTKVKPADSPVVAHRIGSKRWPELPHVVVSHPPKPVPVPVPVKDQNQKTTFALASSKVSVSEHENQQDGTTERFVTASIAGVTISRVPLVTTTAAEPLDVIPAERPPILVVVKPADSESPTDIGREPM